MGPQAGSVCKNRRFETNRRRQLDELVYREPACANRPGLRLLVEPPKRGTNEKAADQMRLTAAFVAADSTGDQSRSRLFLTRRNDCIGPPGQTQAPKPLGCDAGIVREHPGVVAGLVEGDGALRDFLSNHADAFVPWASRQVSSSVRSQTVQRGDRRRGLGKSARLVQRQNVASPIPRSSAPCLARQDWAVDAMNHSIWSRVASCMRCGVTVFPL